MAGAIRRRAKVVGHKIAAGAKAVGFWAKRGTQVATGAQLSERMMAKIPSTPGTIEGPFTRKRDSQAPIEVYRRGKTTAYDAHGRRVTSITVKGKGRVVVSKNFRPGNLLPTRVEKRYQKR